MLDRHSLEEVAPYDVTSRTLFEGIDRSVIDSSKIKDSLISISSCLRALSEDFHEAVSQFEKWRTYYLEELDAYSICMRLLSGDSYEDFEIETRKRFDYLSTIYDFDAFINDFC